MKTKIRLEKSLLISEKSHTLVLLTYLTVWRDVLHIVLNFSLFSNLFTILLKLGIDFTFILLSLFYGLFIFPKKSCTFYFTVKVWLPGIAFLQVPSKLINKRIILNPLFWSKYFWFLKCYQLNAFHFIKELECFCNSLFWNWGKTDFWREILK